MARYPSPGAAKTRLVPALGAEGAAALQRELGAHCLARLRPLAVTGEAAVEVHHDGGTPRALRAWLGSWPSFVPQPPGDLGARLEAALARALSAGAPAAVAVGADCPAVRATHVRDALGSLGTADVVVGPAADGGYWLLGVRSSAADRLASLFEGVSWGSGAVLAETLTRAAAAGLQVGTLEELTDVDHPADLDGWERVRAEDAAAPHTVSVVVPALDEAARIAGAVEAAFAGGATEVVVADGGSTDATAALAAEAGARVVRAPRGRARQMNAGAAAANGDILLFLHADTRPPERFARRVRDALASPGVLGGAFSFAVDADCPASPLVSALGRLRGRLTGLPYGDQALFVRADAFRDLGGFPDQPVMEDWELARRLSRLGEVCILRERAVTSGRRWAEHGLAGATAANAAIVAAYRLGVDPARLDRWRRERTRA